MVGQSSDKPGHFRSLLVIPDKTPYSCIILNDNATKTDVLEGGKLPAVKRAEKFIDVLYFFSNTIEMFCNRRCRNHISEGYLCRVMSAKQSNHRHSQTFLFMISFPKLNTILLHYTQHLTPVKRKFCSDTVDCRTQHLLNDEVNPSTYLAR
jgi:hypothetical protein